MGDQLEDLRKRLDDIDGRLVAALAERQKLVCDVASLKAEGVKFLRDVQREEALLARALERGKAAGLDGYFVTRLFREILDQSVRQQQQRLIDQQNPEPQSGATLVVAYQGTEGAYSHLAAQKHFGLRDAEPRYQGYDSFEEMLDAVRDSEADYAMLPIENTTAGSINTAYDLLARMNLSLVGEEVQRVDHCLLALAAVPLTRVRRIYSHPQALEQCSEFLRSLKHVHVEAFTDTAMAARRLRDEQDLSDAAIASEEAAQLYGLHVLKRSIANQKDNFTRFVVVGREPMKFDARIPCKTSIIFATRDEEGALLRCLNVLHDHELNMTKLESRPRPNAPWEYLFYVDFEGNLAETRVEHAMRTLAAHTSFLKVLGSYPARTTKDARPAEPRLPRAAGTPPVDRVPATPVAAVPALEKKPYKLVSRAQRTENTRIRVGSVVVGGERPVVIAGPCSVESRDQILACARTAKECGADMLRGGCFKPRTSPYAFQGLGYEGLDLLAEAGQAYGLPVVTEVMHPADVEAVAKKADVLQIGARNMQNFSLLKEMGRVDRPVVLKRGMMASIDEWLGAAEYILANGNQQVILCERGIRTFETATRNTLDLSAVPVARELTHLPIIVDPSHACGTWRWIPAMSRAAMAVGSDGIMVEIHPDPAKALSDGPQALTFDGFRKLMESLHTRASG
ncbi:MAG: bifunctional 3-deoxy-7-phosphoheptulonate synthase/chorismate mutase [Phycisphaerae bacterium]|jgi:chorismate mutase/prephenate dehydratase